ncbi:MAG: hypothetical protein LBL25_03495, partial [Oscillospiraceae bacterium]|nr:hypothetical protein [Oscillospiraceae bacterium]
MFGFVSVSSPIGSAHGNILDNITFASGSPVKAEQEISYTGKTELSVSTRAGFAYALAEVRGSSVSTLLGLRAEYDIDGAGGSDSVPISPNGALGNEVSWYSAASDTGVLTFYDLTPGATYRIIGIPQNTINTGLGTNVYPADVLDEGYYTDVKILPAKGDDEGGTVASVTAGLAAGGETAFITVENSLSSAEYALLPALQNDDTKPDTSVDEVVQAWRPGGGELRFDGLDTGKVFFLVVRPLKYSEIDYAAAAYDGETLSARRIVTPAQGQDITAGDVTRAEGGEAITVTDIKTGYTYALVDPDTGEIISPLPASEEDEITFTGLEAEKLYRAVAKPAGGGYMKGVRVYPYPAALEIDYGSDRARLVTEAPPDYIPATIEYKINGGAWTPGTGSGYIDLTNALSENGAVNYRLSAGDFADAKVQPELKLEFKPRSAAPSKEGVNPDFAINYTDEQIENIGSAALEYRAGASGAWETLAIGNNVAFNAPTIGWTGSARPVQLRIKATDTTFASALTDDISINARPAAPQNLTAGEPGGGKVIVSGLTTGANYRWNVSGGTEYSYFEAQQDGKIELDFQAGRSYEFRLAATTEAPISRVATVKPEPLSISAVDFGEVVYGTTITSIPVQVRNTGGAEITDVSFAISGANSGIFKPISPNTFTVPSEGSASLFSVDPAEGTTLSAQTYTATLIATYDTDKTYETEISLTVVKADWWIGDEKAPSVTAEPIAAADSFTVTVANLPADAELEWRLGDKVVYPSESDGVYTFDGLTARTTYPVSVKVLGDNNHNESPLVPLTTAYTAMPAPTASEIVKIDYDKETLGFAGNVTPGNYTVKINGTTIGNGDSLTTYADIGFTLSVARNAVKIAPDSDKDYPASSFSELIVPKRPDEPTFNAPKAATTDTSADGEITYGGNFQYRAVHAGGTGDWRPATNSAFVRAGEYNVRLTATNTAFASAPATVTVPYKNREVSIQSIAADGTAGAADTATLTLTFSIPVSGFTTSHIAFTGDNSGVFSIVNGSAAPKGGVSPGAVWTVGVTASPAAAGDNDTIQLTAAITGWQDNAGLGYSPTASGGSFTFTANRAIPEATPAATIDYVTERIIGLIANANYIIDTLQIQTDASGSLEITSWMDGKEHTIQKIGGPSSIISAARKLIIPTRPAMPVVESVDPKTQSDATGSIVIKNPLPGKTYEYHKDDEDVVEWIVADTANDLDGDITVPGIHPDRYYVRVKASNTADAETFASVRAPIRVHAYNEVNFGEVYEDYSVVTEKAIVGTEDLTISNVKFVDGENADISNPETNVKFTLSGSGSNRTIAPKPNLDWNAAAYTARIKIEYEDTEGQSNNPSYQDIRFRVHPKAEIEKVEASSTTSGGVTDNLKITFARPTATALEYSDFTVAGAAIKAGSEFVSTSDNTVYTLAVIPASMAYKTGDEIAVSVDLTDTHLRELYQFQNSVGKEPQVQYPKADTDEVEIPKITIPRAIETAKAVTLIDNYSTSFIQFTLKRETDGYYPIE